LDQDVAEVSGDQTIVTDVGLSKVEGTGTYVLILVNGRPRDIKLCHLEVLKGVCA